MSGVVTVESASSPQREAVSVTMMPGAVGTHVGLRYLADDDGSLRHLHLAFHYRLVDEAELEPGALRVVSGIEEDALSDVASMARLIAKRHADGRVPYAFQRGASFDTHGKLSLGKSLGLTCATFVLAVFESAKVFLLDEPSWDAASAERVKEDKEAQAHLVEFLRKKDPTHAALVEGEIGCARFRGEEVAAASGLNLRPVQFSVAEIEGRELLSLISL